jgi:hypothetical protein
MVWHSYYRAQIEERQFQKKHFLAQDSTFYSHKKNLTKQLVLVANDIFKLNDSQEKTLGDESSLTLESESEMCHEALAMRQRTVKSLIVRLGLSSFSELDESSLKKSMSLNTTHNQDIIF